MIVHKLTEIPTCVLAYSTGNIKLVSKDYGNNVVYGQISIKKRLFLFKTVADGVEHGHVLGDPFNSLMSLFLEVDIGNSGHG
jgi:hypothetical protein